MATATLKSITGVSDPLKELTSKAEEAGRKEQETSSAVQKLEIDKAAAEAQRADVQAKTKVAGTEEAMARQTARETPIKEQKLEIDTALMNEHFKPSKENLQDQAALFSLINVIGFAIGAGGKQNSMQALYAMNGMLEGHQKGRGDLFKEEQVKFEKNFKALQQKANFLESELRHSLEEFTRDKRAADERASAAFASSGADFMKQYAEKYGLVEAHKRALEVKKSADKAVDEYQKEQRRKQDKIEAEGRHLEQMKELKQFGANFKTPAAGSKTTAADKYGYGVGPSALVEEFIGERLPTKQAEPIIQSAAAIGEANQLKQIVRADPGIVGREGQVRQFINRYIDSALSGQKLPTDEESGLDQKALLFAKRYASYLVNYERSLAPGARGFTVFFQKRFNDLMQPNQFNASGMIGLLDDQIREVATQATRISKKANAKNLSALGADITGRSETSVASDTTKSGETPRRSFNSIQEAEAANLDKGTKILVGGKPATVE
jgi:hypothetical protein